MKILLAEDDNSISIIAKTALERMGGHEVTVAGNGGLAMDHALAENFDLILLDSMMPVKDGLTVCKELKVSDKKGIPVIFLSAKSQDADIAEGIACGAIGYIQKPFDPKSLCGQIDTILKEKGGDTA